MIKKDKNRKNRVGLLTLNRKFYIIITIGIFVSYFILILSAVLLEPLLNKINPGLNKVNESLATIGQELYQLSEDPSWSTDGREKLPEIDKILAKYPQYQFSYEVYPGIDRITFDINGMLESSKVNSESYSSIVLEAKDAVIVVGVNVPELVRFGVAANIVVILFFLTVLLFFIGIFVSRKVRYLKSMARSLEYIAGGDLSIRIPVKGRDEISQVARHINDMTAALSDEIRKEKETEATKKQLITNISHDLRTPLTAVVGYLSVLETMDISVDPEKVKQYIRRAYEKSDSLSHLVDQLFDYVLLSNQQTKFIFSEVEPSIYFMQAFSELENLLERINMEMSCSFKFSDRNINIDFTQMKRVIENLGQNICKYAKEGTKVTAEGIALQEHYILTVTNETEEMLSDSSVYLNRYFTTDRTSGKSAGLGLAICKELVEQQQGEFIIRAEQFRFQTIIQLPLSPACCDRGIAALG